MRMAFGVRRLDDAIGGGLPERSSTLLFGPPFVGKETLAKLFILNGLRQGVPGIMVLTDDSAADMRAQFASLDAQYAEFEKRGLVNFVDCYSKSIGAVEANRFTEYVDGLVNFNAVSLAVNNAQRKIIADHAYHRLLFDSVSTLITYTDAATAFRFLQVLLGKARASGATTLLSLEQGMHTESEVQTIKHLTSGMVEFKSEGGKTLLRAEGSAMTENRGWVDYRATDSGFEITGSFAMGRIR